MNSSINQPFDMVPAASATLAERKAFLVKVYSYVGLACLSCAAGSYFVAREMLPVIKIPMNFMGILLYMGILYGGFFLVHAVGSIPGVGVAALVAFTTFIGWFYAPLFLHYLQAQPEAFMMAGGTTLMIFGSLTGYVLLSKKDFSFMGGALSILTGLVIAAVIFSMIFKWTFVLSMGWSFFIVALFSGWLLYDTSNVLHHYPTNMPVQAAIGIFWDVLVIFIELLRIFGILGGGDD